MLRDRRDPSAVSRFVDALSRPLPIDEVETIEGEAKELWHDVLLGAPPDERDAAAFVAFFNRLGFLFKYKSYGTKIATPFGFSLFDLHEGEGFSFQLHREPKLEAFHILKPSSGAFVYLSSVDEWTSDGRDAAKSWVQSEGRLDSPFAFAPEPGDVFIIDTTEIVHTAVGCVLEEYASCSVDAVERLFDQNEGRSVELPGAHPSVPEVLRGSHLGGPARRIEREPQGWRKAVADRDAEIIDVPGKLRGGRVVLSTAQRYEVDAPPGHVGVAVVLDGEARCEVLGEEPTLAVGELVPIPAGTRMRFTGGPGGATLAVHTVAGELLMREWTR